MAYQSKRLIIRPLSSSDVVAIHSLHTKPEVDEFNTLGIPKDFAETEEIVDSWIKKENQTPIEQYTFVIETQNSKDFVGIMALGMSNAKYNKAEIWYKLMPTFWGNGYATEAIKWLLEFAFEELHLHRVEAGCAVDNEGSIRVLEKIGMLKEGRKREVLPLKRGWSDNYIYAILKEDKRPK